MISDHTTRSGVIFNNVKKPESELVKIQLQHQMDIETEDHKFKHQEEHETYKSCCFTMKKDGAIFVARILISLSTMSLCSYQLITLKDCQYQSLYSGLLGLVIGHWLKN